jgi:hypothetical protein
MSENEPKTGRTWLAHLNIGEPMSTRLAEIRVDPHLFLSLWQEGMESHCWRVISGGLPPDVKVRLLGFDPEIALVRIVLEHPSFAEQDEAADVPLLPPPLIAVGHDDHEHAPRAAFAEY